MRAECQVAEEAVSYLRRMAQGRLDLVHACLDHHDEGGDSTRSVERCRRSSDRARPAPRDTAGCPRRCRPISTAKT